MRSPVLPTHPHTPIHMPLTVSEKVQVERRWFTVSLSSKAGPITVCALDAHRPEAAFSAAHPTSLQLFRFAKIQAAVASIARTERMIRRRFTREYTSLLSSIDLVQVPEAMPVVQVEAAVEAEVEATAEATIENNVVAVEIMEQVEAVAAVAAVDGEYAVESEGAIVSEVQSVKPVESEQGKRTEQQARWKDSGEDDLFWTTDTVQRRTKRDRSLKGSFLMGLERLHDQADFEPDDPLSPGLKPKARPRRKAIIHVKPIQTGSVRRWVVSVFVPSFNRSENDLVRSLCCYELLADRDTDDDGQGDRMRFLFSRTVDETPRPWVR